jgi:hypothetical protein
MRRTGTLALVLTAAAGLALAAPADAATSFSHPIRNYGNDMCLQPDGDSTEPGAAIVQEPCNGSLAQDWGFLTLGGTRNRLINHSSGMCMDAFGGATNGTPIVQWPCATITNETWSPSRPLPEIVSLRSRVAGTNSHCLDVPYGQAVPGLQMQLYACNGTAAQTWLVGIGIVIQT